VAGNYDSVDLDFSWDGDLLLDNQGDIKDTSEDLLLSIRNEMFTIVKSSLGDWKEDITVGADLDDFVGESNSRETAENIKIRLESSLSQLVSVSDVEIRVTPVSIYKVLISLSLAVLATAENRIQSGTVISATFLYDYLEKGVYVDLDNRSRFDERGTR